MDDANFQAYLSKRKSSVTGKPLSKRVVGIIVSRCRSIERRYGLDLDNIPLEGANVERKFGARGGFEDVISDGVQGDYLSAVRKYLDYRVASRRASSSSRS